MDENENLKDAQSMLGSRCKVQSSRAAVMLGLSTYSSSMDTDVSCSEVF